MTSTAYVAKPWPTIEHLPAPSNPAITLCQEYTMRTGGYDEKARLWSKAVGDTTFAANVFAFGLDEAIRDVERCAWLSRDDKPGGPSGPCIECWEARYA